MLKKTLLMLITSAIVLNTSAIAADWGITYDENEKSVYISGNAGAYNVGKDVTCMLIKKGTDIDNAENSDIGYMSQSTVDANGQYDFNFKFNGNADDYRVEVNQAGKSITSTVTNAGVIEKNDYYVYDDFEGCQLGAVGENNQNGWVVKNNTDGRNIVDGNANITDAATDTTARGWFFAKGENDGLEIADTTDKDGLTTQALKITYNPDSDNAERTFDIIRKFGYTTSADDKIKISFKFRTENPQPAMKGLGSWYWGNVYYGSSTNLGIQNPAINMVYDFQYGYGCIRGNDSTNLVLMMLTSNDSFKADKWHEFEYYADFKNHTLEYYIDNNLKITSNLDNSIDMAKKLAWKINGGGSEVPVSFYFDDICVEKLNDFTLKDCSITDTINLQFNYPVSVEQALYAISIKENERLLSHNEYTASTESNNTIKLTPVNGIKNHAKYEISIKDDMVDSRNYRTIIKKYDLELYSEYKTPYIDRETLTTEDNNKGLIINFNINNPTNENKSLWCIAAATDSNNRIISIDSILTDNNTGSMSIQPTPESRIRLYITDRDLNLYDSIYIR